MKGSTTDIVSTNIHSALSLEWKARNLAKGLNIGKHRSKKLGIGMEFNQFRNYVQGDDIRLLDWKMYAKTRQYFIRQSDIETNHKLHIIIDNSKSMNYAEGENSKLDLAKVIAATLTYVIAQQTDQFSWQSGQIIFSKCHGLKNWRRSVLELNKLESEDLTNWINVHKGSEIKMNSGIHLWITDLYVDLEEFRQFVAVNQSPNKELVIFHLIARKEEKLSFDNNSKFIDLESGEEMQVDAKKYAAKYQEALGQHIHQVKRICQNKGIVYRKIYLQCELKDELSLFLSDYNSLTP